MFHIAWPTTWRRLYLVTVDIELWRHCTLSVIYTNNDICFHHKVAVKSGMGSVQNICTKYIGKKQLNGSGMSQNKDTRRVKHNSELTHLLELDLRQTGIYFALYYSLLTPPIDKHRLHKIFNKTIWQNAIVTNTLISNNTRTRHGQDCFVLFASALWTSYLHFECPKLQYFNTISLHLYAMIKCCIDSCAMYYCNFKMCEVIRVSPCNLTANL